MEEIIPKRNKRMKTLGEEFSMARRPRIHFPGALYHVITRGNRIQGIFLDEKDMKKFLAYLVEYKSRRPFRLYAYALMKNHLFAFARIPCGLPQG